MKMQKNRTFLFSIRCEGKSEQKFINKIKDEVLINKKISFCKNKKHSKLIGGSININSIEDTKDCCKSFIVIDKDNLENLNQLKEKSMRENITLIITEPCFELILLSLFTDKLIFDKRKIENELAKLINENNYSHSVENLEKIFNKAFASNDKKTKTIDTFEKNLKFLNSKNKSNFILLYEFLKGGK